MSFSHHSAEEDAARNRLLDEFLKTAPIHHPEGRLNDQDQGESAIAIAHDPVNGVVVINFAKPMRWIGFNLQQAKRIHELLGEKIALLEK